MRINTIGIELEISTTTLVTLQGDTIIVSGEVISKVACCYAREIKAIYLLPDSDERPALLVEWRCHRNAIDQYDLLELDFSKDELQLLYDMGIL